MSAVARFLVRVAAAFALLCLLGFAYSLVSGSSWRFSVTAVLLLGGCLIMVATVGAPSFFGRRGFDRNSRMSDQSPRAFSWVLTGLCIFVAGIAAAVWLPVTHDAPGPGRCVNVTTGDGGHWHLFGHSPKLIKGRCQSGASG